MSSFNENVFIFEEVKDVIMTESYLLLSMEDGKVYGFRLTRQQQKWIRKRLELSDCLERAQKLED